MLTVSPKQYITHTIMIALNYNQIICYFHITMVAIANICNNITDKSKILLLLIGYTNANLIFDCIKCRDRK